MILGERLLKLFFYDFYIYIYFLFFCLFNLCFWFWRPVFGNLQVVLDNRPFLYEKFYVFLIPTNKIAAFFYYQSAAYYI